VKKLLPPLVAVFLVFFVITNPGQSADFLRAAFSGVVAFAQALASGGGQ